MDGIRAVAVLLVLIYHSWVISGQPNLLLSLPFISRQLNVTPIVSSGFIGVQLFFALSGFLLAQYWLKPSFQGKPRPSTRQYFKQRLLRIVPAYYCCLFLLLLFFVPALIPVASVYSRIGVFVLGAHLLFLQYLFPVSSASYIIDGSLWTLTMEMLFYVSLPLAIWLFVKNRWIYSLFAAILVSLGWLYLTRNSLGPLVRLEQYHTPGVTLTEDVARYFLSVQFPTHFGNFALGITLANIYTQYQLKTRTDRLFRIITGNRAALVYFIAGWALEFFLMYVIRQTQNQTLVYYSYFLIASLGFTLILAGILFGGQWIRSMFSFTPLRLIGIISYSIYLWHLPIIHLFNSYPNILALPPERRFLHVLLGTASSVFLLAAGLYLAVEKPFMVLGRKKSPTKRLGADRESEVSLALALPLSGLPNTNKDLAEIVALPVVIGGPEE